MLLSSPQKKLGVLAGMGPAAGAEFLRLLTVKAPAERDQDHPVVYLLSDAKVPDRVAAIAGHGEDPTERLRRRLVAIAGWGVDYLAVPCNTAHVFIDRFRDSLPIPLIHIVEETIRSCMRLSPKGAWLLATTGTCRCGLYQQYAQKLGYTFFEVDAARQTRVQECVTLVKANKMPEAGQLMRSIVEELWAQNDICAATACTELPLAYDASGLSAERSVSSLGALSDACLSALYGDGYLRRLK